MATTTELERSLARSRMLNLVLAASTVILIIVVIAMALGNREQIPVEAGPVEDVAQSDQVDGSLETADEAAADRTIGEEGPFVRRDSDDPMAIGAVDAPVVMSEWIDFQCPYCARFSNEVMPDLISQYVDPGLLRIEFHDVSFFGDASTSAAIAARAAGQQGMYVEYLKGVYALSADGDHPELNRDVLVEVARTVGVPDMASFEAALDDPALEQAVLDSTSQAQSLGVTSVPFFVIGEGYIAGAQPMEQFQTFIETALDEAGR